MPREQVQSCRCDRSICYALEEHEHSGAALASICVLARTASASDEVTVNGYWSKGVNGTTTGVMEATDSISTFAVSAEPRERCWFGVWPRAAAACGVSRRGSALGCSRAPESGKSRRAASGRLACAQCAQMGEAEQRLTLGGLHRSRTTAC